jgi:hypothetical protein
VRHFGKIEDEIEKLKLGIMVKEKSRKKSSGYTSGFS